MKYHWFIGIILQSRGLYQQGQSPSVNVNICPIYPLLLIYQNIIIISLLRIKNLYNIFHQTQN